MMELHGGTCVRLYWQAVTGCGPRNSSGGGSATRNRSNTAPSSAGVFQPFIKHPLTDLGVNKFLADSNAQLQK